MKNIVNGSIVILGVLCAGMVYQQNEMMNQNDKIMMVAAVVIMSFIALFSYNKVNVSPTVVTNKISDLIITSILALFQPKKTSNMVVRARNKRK